MKQKELYDTLLGSFSEKFEPLHDKPEETASATLKALWFMATGVPKSAQSAEISELPELKSDQQETLSNYIEQRLGGVPLAHITGRQQFMGIELLASSGALVPRKETEILGNAVVQLMNEVGKQKDEIMIIDICTGAANLAISYAINNPKARIYASDLSAEAVALARENVDLHDLASRIQIYEGDLLAPFDSSDYYGSVDILSCNPPYISSAKVVAMPGEISEHEPHMAFDGGPFGIAILQRLIKEAPKYLRTGAWLAFEVGLGQVPPLLKRLKKDKSYDELRVATDQDNQERVILARMAK